MVYLLPRTLRLGLTATVILLALRVNLPQVAAGQTRPDIDDPVVPSESTDGEDAGADALPARFMPPAETDYGEYATAVVSDGDNVFVGWPGRRGPERSRRGGVHWLRRSGETWSRIIIEPPGEDRTRFGSTLASVDGTLFVTSRNQIDAYAVSGSTVTYETSLIGDQDRFRPSGKMQTMGSDRLAVVGEYRDNDGEWRPGFGLFRRTGSMWSLESQIPSSGRIRDVCSTGQELATVSTDIMLADSSTVYGIELFGPTDGRWARTDVLVPASTSGGSISSWVTCADDLIVAPSHASAVFRRTDAGWVEEEPIPAPDGILVMGGELNGEYLYLIQCENVRGEGFSAEEFFIRTIRRANDLTWDVRSRVDSRERLRPLQENDNGYLGYAMSFSDELLVLTAPFRRVDDKGYGEVNIYPIEAADPRRYLGPEELPAVPNFPALSLESLYPNPARNGARLSVSLPERSRVSVAVYDALGRLAGAETVMDLDPGTHRVDLSTSNLAPGSYMVRTCVARASACATQILTVLN